MSDLISSKVFKESSIDHQDCMRNINYICSLTELLKKAFNKGNDVAHLPNGDVLITETKVIYNHTYYAWDPEKGKLVESR